MFCSVCIAAGCGSDKAESAGTGGRAAAAADTGGATAENNGGVAAVLLGDGGPSTDGAVEASGGTSAGGGGDTAGGAGGDDGYQCAPTPGSGVLLTCPTQSDLASWLPDNPGDSCTKGCGPDKIGVKTCARTEEDVCSVPPCAQCDLCTYPVPMLPCYETPNDPELPLPPDCPEGTYKSDPCEQPCDCTTVSSLCIHVNPSDNTKIEGCVCAERGKWACSTYNVDANTWN